MRQKWLELSIGQKVIFCLQIVLIVLFLILYSTVGRQQVLHYHGEALRRTEAENAVIYSGKLSGRPISYTVTDTTVEYRYGDKTLLYTATDDPSAVPPEGAGELPEALRQQLKGVEIRKNGELLFRGGWGIFGSSLMLYNEDGSSTVGIDYVIYSTSGPVLNDPSASTILRLIHIPDVNQRANFLGLLCGIFLCVACMVSLMYADRLFRWNLRFSIRNVEDAEPSDWELFSRWIGWLLFTALAIAIFILGLTGM